MGKEIQFEPGSKRAPFCGDHGCDPSNYMMPEEDPFFRPKNKRNVGRGWANYGLTGSLSDAIQASCHSDATEDSSWQDISGHTYNQDDSGE